MVEMIFAFDERNYRACQQAFRGTKGQDYYLGDYSIEAGSVVDVKADKKVVGVSSIVRLRSRSRLFFRRAWSHIREDATDVTVLWFVKRGNMSVTHQAGSTIARSGDFIVTKSSTPFYIECQPDAEGMHEVLHLIIPTAALSRLMPHEVRTGFHTPAGGREFAIAERLLLHIFESEDDLAEHVAQQLLDAVLSVLSDAVKGRSIGEPARETPAEVRLKEVLRFIEIHVSDANLTITTVANACSISVRYLSYLFKQRGTSFSRVVWGTRLELARDWLARSHEGEISVAEIAYGVGFKSPPHFSRMFKRVYKLSPCAYREAGLTDSSLASHQRVVHAPSTAIA